MVIISRAVLGLEADVLDQLFHHRLQAPRADALDAFVHLAGNARHLADCLGVKSSVTFSVAMSAVYCSTRLAHIPTDADEVLLGQRLQLNADRRTALQFGNIPRLGDVGAHHWQ